MGQGTGEITLEIAEEVVNPGVYKLPEGNRVGDLLIISGGFSADADRSWTDEYLNKGTKLIDGQKIFILSVNNQSMPSSARSHGEDQTISSSFSGQGSGLVNITSEANRI